MASYTVSQRVRELGPRIALGANQRKVLSAALGRAFRLLAVGLAAGMILGVFATRVLSFIVYQASPKYPLIPGGGGLTMLGIGIDPGRRALAVDPMTHWCTCKNERTCMQHRRGRCR
jgi:ABC-type antimicrobial peptide transport system permease subunit